MSDSNIIPLVPNIAPEQEESKAVASIKNAFASSQKKVSTPPIGEGLIIQANADGSVRVDPTQQHQGPPPDLKFFPYADGSILAWIKSPSQPNFMICVNTEESETLPPKPACIAITPLPSVAQMICDGVNFLFHVRQKKEELAALKASVPGSEASTKFDDKPLGGLI